MLRELYIKNYGIFSEERLRFDDGMTILSGETGAGKSLIVGAIALLLGSRADLDDVRSGEENATLEGVFELEDAAEQPLKALLDEAGIDYDLAQPLVIRRVIQANGRSRAFINDRSTTVRLLGQMAPYLVDLAGQHEHQVLLDEAEHLVILDRSADFSTELQKYQGSYREFRQLMKRCLDLRERAKTAQERLEFIQYRVRELEKRNLEAGEDEALQSKRQRMLHSAQLYEIVQECNQALDREESGVASQLKHAARELEKGGRYDETLNGHAEMLNDASSIINEVSRALDDYGGSLDFDPSERDRIEERLSELGDVRRQYGSIETALTSLSEMRVEVDELSNIDADLEQYALRYAELRQEVMDAALALREQRLKAAEELEANVIEQLRGLEMKGAKFAVECLPLNADDEAYDIDQQFFEGDQQPIDQSLRFLNPYGADRVRFLFSANVGEPVKALSKIASGGELSRIMLALKLSLPRPICSTYIFDEVDTGIGGRQAEVMGQKLASLARPQADAAVQVFCVTHLAPIAIHADHHALIEKRRQGKRTIAHVRRLCRDERVREVARMLAGTKITQRTLAHAEELLG